MNEVKNFLSAAEQETLSSAREHLIARDDFETASKSIEAVEACLNGGPSPEQAKMVSTMLLRLLQNGSIQSAGILAFTPIVQKLKAAESGD